MGAMLEYLNPTAPTIFEDSDSVLGKAYHRDLDFTDYYLDMAAKRPFSLRDDSSSPAPRMRGGRITTDVLQAQAEPYSPPPPADVETYVKRPLPALPGRRHSTASTLSKELNMAFATPDTSSVFREGENGTPKRGADAGNVMDWETEISVVLNRPSEDTAGRQRLPQPAQTDVRFKVSRSRQSEILAPQPKLEVQKLFRLTATGGPKLPVVYPVVSVSTAPSGHNSIHKIKQLMGVDVAPRNSDDSSELRRRNHWSHDAMYGSDQDLEVSEVCFLDSDDDDDDDDDFDLEDPQTPINPRGESGSGVDSPFPSPLVIKKKRIIDDAARPSSSGGERKFVSQSHLYYKEDLYHRTASQLSQPTWRHSGSAAPSSPSTGLRESHGSSSFNSKSHLLKNDINKDSSPLRTPSIQVQGEQEQGKSPDTVGSPATNKSSPGMLSTEATTPLPRKRATSAGAFGNIGQRWQSWQHRSPQHRDPYPRNQVKIPYDPATDPHPGIRIVLPYELEEEECPIRGRRSGSNPSSPISGHRSPRQSIVSKVLKRISGSTTPTHYQRHMKRPSEPTTPTWLAAGVTPTSSPIQPQSPLHQISPPPTDIDNRVADEQQQQSQTDQPSKPTPTKIIPPARVSTPENPQLQNQRSSFSISEPSSPVALRSVSSSLGFRSPQQIVAPSLRAVNELVGQATKKLSASISGVKSRSASGGATGSGSGSGDLEETREAEAERWREGMKSRIRVLDDGGRVLGAGGGGVEKLAAGQSSEMKAPPERPERSPVVSSASMVGFPSDGGGEDGTEGRRREADGSGSGNGEDSASPSSSLPSPSPLTGLLPPPVPPKSAARPLSGVSSGSGSGSGEHTRQKKDGQGRKESSLQREVGGGGGGGAGTWV